MGRDPVEYVVDAAHFLRIVSTPSVDAVDSSKQPNSKMAGC